MDYMTIDGIMVPIEDEKNILSLIRKAGIDIPTFCYHSDLSIYGACRMCMVEDDRGNIEAACQMAPFVTAKRHSSSDSVKCATSPRSTEGCEEFSNLTSPLFDIHDLRLQYMTRLSPGSMLR